MAPTPPLDERLADILPLVRETRRILHRHPELSGQEFRTTDLLAGILREHGLSPTVRAPKTGLWVDIGQGRPTVAFRADIDALPINEPPGPHSSLSPGVMHACGHDAHAAIALGVALALDRRRLSGRARVIFQPAEETFPGGAFELAREGVLEGVSAIFAFHVDPSLDSGRLGFRAGAVTSSADRFFISLEGPGGHTARPHATVDLVYAAGVVITQLPALLGRLLDARSPTTLVFGRVEGGTADNVIPTQVELSGTVRTADRDLWDEVPGLVEELVQELVAPLGAKAILHYQRGIPPVINDAAVVATLERAAAGTVGEEGISTTHLSMGAEDFSRYLEEVPGALVRLGCRAGDLRCDLHSARFELDEDCLEVGVRVGVAGVEALLGSQAVSTS